MSRYHRTTCPICEQCISRNSAGAFRNHGPRRSPCAGSGRNFVEAHGLAGTVTDSQLAVLCEAWRTADWLPVEREFHVRFTPRYAVEGHTVDDELERLVFSVRDWLEVVVGTVKHGCAA